MIPGLVGVSNKGFCDKEKRCEHTRRIREKECGKLNSEKFGSLKFTEKNYQNCVNKIFFIHEYLIAGKVSD